MTYAGRLGRIGGALRALTLTGNGADEEKGLFRAMFGGPEGTVAAVFRHFAQNAARFPAREDPRWRISHVRVDLPEGEGRGYWRFLSLGDDVFAVITDCDYAVPRRERVVAEGLVEFHFLLEAPVELSLPKEAEGTVPAGVTLLACQQAQGLNYEVACQPGSFRMVSLYAGPKVLEDSFGFGLEQGSTGYRLLHPAPGTISISERKIDLDFLGVLQRLFEIGFDERRDLAMAASYILQLLSATAAVFDQPNGEAEDAMVFTARELAMFERAREILSTDFAGSLTIPGLARTLGTNSTKLKSGFKFLYGTTIFNFRNRHRMDRAMHLLVSEKLPISTIAQAVGFRHQASFTTAFRAHFGFPPKHARKLQAQALDDGEEEA